LINSSVFCTSVLEIGCGTGIDLRLFPDTFEIHGIDLNEDALKIAREKQSNATFRIGNIEENGLSNIRVIKGDVEDILETYQFQCDLAIIDPPRAGLTPKALTHLINLRPKKILYISCNPLSQSENISTLIQHGYHLDAIQSVDQFPHTTHIENIAILTNNPFSFL